MSNMKLIDKFGRVHDYVRISLIDKCNLNCIYCNPSGSKHFPSINRVILSYEELYRLIEILVATLGVRKIRFTGGEPLIRKEILKFFEMVSALKSRYDFEIGITTNGTHLLDKLEYLYQFGIGLLNISLDSLDRQKFIAITGKDKLAEVILSIQKAIETGFKAVKVNTVVIKGFNNDELISLIEYFKNYPLILRFIEYMPFTNNRWEEERFMSWESMKQQIETYYSLSELKDTGIISKNYKVDGTYLKIGFISSISDHFCDSCNRLRITATGHIKTCLFSNSTEVSLKPLLSNQAISDENIAKFILDSLQSKWIKHPGIHELVELKTNHMMTIGG